MGPSLCTMTGGMEAFLTTEVAGGAVALSWLGQSGFALRHGDSLLLIDPYLSDHPVSAYARANPPQTRMMSAPIEADAFCGVDFVLCTHAHEDSMDPGTLPSLTAHCPGCEFVIPRAERDAALAAGAPRDLLVAVEAGDSEQLTPDIQLQVIPAAHETLETSEDGGYPCLGYILKLGRHTIYHSGDTLSYAALPERLKGAEIHLALLPVSGSDPRRRRQGIPGVLDFDEAVRLCERAEIPYMMGHHFGMFACDTAAPEMLRDAADGYFGDTQCIIPETGRYYLLA